MSAAQQVGPGLRACSNACSQQSQVGLRHMSLAWDLHARVANFGRQLWVLELFKPRRPHRAFVATESVTCIGQCALDIIPRSVERCRLGEGKLQPEHKHNLPGTGSLPASSRRAVNSPAIVTSLPEPCVAKAPIVPRISQQVAGMHTSPLPNTVIEKSCRRRSPDQLVARHLHPLSHPLGATRFVVRPAPNYVHGQRRGIWRAKSQVGGVLRF